MKNLENTLQRYDYHFPQELIAQKPASPRESARLLAYDRLSGKESFDTFANLGKHLPKGAILVFNQTKVWPARLKAEKESGGKTELLYIDSAGGLVKALSNRPLKPNAKLAVVRGKKTILRLEVIKKMGQFYYFKPSVSTVEFLNILKKYGVTPLPPYIKNSPLTEKQKRQQYQSVFARSGLSVAAPTASLHFTKKLLSQLKKQGIEAKFVRLDVGMGTFAPLKDENLTTGKLHEEFFQIDKATAKFLNSVKKQGRPVIAVGTTVCRTLESAAKDGQLVKLSGSTDLFIQEGYKFKFTDGLITNFHVPKSSLLMLVSALVGRKNVLNLYKRAIQKKFRLFSFGDGMLLY